MTTAPGPDVTVLDLPCFGAQVPDTALGSDVAQILEKDPALPGVIVMHGREVIGLVARNQFFHRLGRRFGIEIFTPRPITAYLDQLPGPPIIVPEETTVRTPPSAASPARPRTSTTRLSSRSTPGRPGSSISSRSSSSRPSSSPPRGNISRASWPRRPPTCAACFPARSSARP